MKEKKNFFYYNNVTAVVPLYEIPAVVVVEIRTKNINTRTPRRRRECFQ